MKRVYQPYGSPRAKFSAAKRSRKTVPGPSISGQTYRRSKYNTNSRVSVFQKASGVELKNIDDAASKWTNLASTWTITCLNDVVQGTSGTTRIGRKILMKSLICQGYLTNTSNIARILIVYDKQSNGAAPAATDVLTSNTIFALMNLDNRDRFIVVADIYPFAQSENLAGNDTTTMAYYLRRKMNLETIYSGNAGTVADITSGGLFMMTNVNGGTIAGESGITRIRFVDE